MKQRYWILIGYVGILFLGPWITDFFVRMDLKQRNTGSWLLEVLYAMVMKGVWMWAYALFIALLIGAGIWLFRAPKSNELQAGFKLVAVLHTVLMIGLLTYSFFADSVA